MSGKDVPARGETFVSRWSRRKAEAAREPLPPAAETKPLPAAAPTAGPEPRSAPPPLESLTPESDFRPFLDPQVDEGVRRQALKTLFGDPHFNVMDGLDVYIDDYSKPDPLPESWLAMMTRNATFESPEEKPGPEAPAAAEGDPEPAREAVADQEDTAPAEPGSADTANGQVRVPPVTE